MTKKSFYALAPLVAVLAGALAGPAAAGVTAEEAQKLKGPLTPMGAEKAGNKEGTIPEWTGGYTKAEPGRTDRRYDPFPEDKPLFSITAKNMDQYADKLSDGAKAILKLHPDTFRMDVYQTRRTAAAPQHVYDAVFKNATSASLENDGMSLRNAKGGVAFPIPKNGMEVRWNHLTRWLGEAIEMRNKLWVVTSDGQVTLSSQNKMVNQWPYNHKDNGRADEFELSILTVEAPAFRAGEALLVREPTDFMDGRRVWQYLAGQRRVRRAPTIGYDTPDFIASGIGFFDEAMGGISQPDRYDFKLLGKKEMFIPYNTNRLFMHKDQDVIGANHLKPEFVRWELHRVWVIEATLRNGKRHAVPRRMTYYDEDTWSTAMMDGWDPQGKLWHVDFMLSFVAPDIPAVMPYCTDMFFNLQTKSWLYRCAYGDSDLQFMPVKIKSDTYYSPENLNAQSAR